MATSLGGLRAEALRLSRSDRAALARALLLSLEDREDEGTEKAWAEEAERRYQEIKAGAVEVIPSEEVFADARARLK